MTREDIIQKLEQNGFSSDSGETQLHHYTATGKRKSLTKEQVNNRNSTGWGRGEYIVIGYEHDNYTLEDLLAGWKRLAVNYKNQYLILEVSKDEWHVYDYDGNKLGENDYIENLFKGRVNTNRSLQKIFFGCPGAGKSYHINNVVKNELYIDEDVLRLHLKTKKVNDATIAKYLGVMKLNWICSIASRNGNTIESIYEIKDPEEIKRIQKDEEFIRHNKTGNNMYSSVLNHYLELLSIFRTTFHPDTDYASFVGCFKPLTRPNGSIAYTFCPQIFTDAYVAAWKNPERNVHLIIEEINRGNCAQIFGDIFQLLDRKDGYSEYPIKADNELADYLESQLGKGANGIINRQLCLPPNLIIYATMNTSDQSLFPMDSAFKRRWDWEYIPIDLKCQASNFTIDIDGKKYSWLSFLEKVNDHILRLTESEDKQLGNFFIKKNISKDEFKSKVMFYLWSEVCKDYYNSDSFFKYNDGHNDIEFTFNMLFSGNDTTILQGFMKKLDVTEI